MSAAIILTPEEARVLGCLIEKSQATPEYYPLSLNALTNACNQKNSRDPVVNYSDGEVQIAIDLLREKGLCSSLSGGGRVVKYIHRCEESGMAITNAERAILSLLLLRGPQTAAELKTRSVRQHEFTSREELQETLDRLGQGDRRLVEKTPRRHGEVETRYRHRLFAYDDSPAVEQPAPAPSLRDTFDSMQQKLDALEAENAALHERFAALESDIAAIKRDLYS